MLEMDGFGCGSVVDPLVLSEGARLAAGKVSLVFLVQITEPRQERRSKPSPPIKKKKDVCAPIYIDVQRVTCPSTILLTGKHEHPIE